MRRKLFDYTACLIAGILLTYYLSNHLSKPASLLCLGLCGGFLFLQARQSAFLHVKTVCLGFCVFGMVLMLLTELSFAQGYLHEQSLLSPESTSITGRVVHVEVINEETYRLTLNVQRQRLLCTFYGSMENPWELLGCKISFSGEIEEPSKAGNPRCFDYGLYLRSLGIGYTASTKSFEVVDGNRGLWHRIEGFVLEKREGFLAQFRGSDTAKAMLRGILFGDTNQMDEELYEDFRRNGTAHVLAVSGLHVGILYGVYKKIYERLHSRLCTVALFLLLFIYGTATIWSVSVTRAIILICLIVAGEILHRRYDLLTALAAVALIVIVRNPYVIFGASFQMSFLAVASIVFLREPMEWMVGRGMATSLAVQMGLLPYMAYVFNSISLVGIFCNIPVIYLTSLLVPIGMLGFMSYFTLGVSIPMASALLDGLAEMLITVNGWFSADGWLSFDVVSPPLWTMVLVYGLAFYGTSEQARVHFGRKEWGKALRPVAAIFLAAVVAVPLGSSPFDDASMIFVDVGQGDCIHIKDTSGRNVLIDGGGNINYNVGKRTLKPYLLKNGVDRLELAAATHLHTDHYLGLTQLAETFDVTAVLTKGKAGQILRLGEEQWIEILWPLTEESTSEDENLNSLIFMIHDRGVRTLITGDITAEGEAMLVAQYKGTDKLQADVLKIAHHGSAYSTSDAFVEAVNPKMAVISVGRNNYGHPSEIIIEKLEKQGIMVFRTDLDGAVGMINRKGKISVCTKKQR